MRILPHLLALVLGATLINARAASDPVSCVPSVIGTVPLVTYEALRPAPVVIRVIVDVTCSTKKAQYSLNLSAQGSNVQLLRGTEVVNATVRLTGSDTGLPFGGDVNAIPGPNNGQGSRIYRHELEFQIEPGQWGSSSGTYTYSFPLIVSLIDKSDSK